jgi:hypothetical protein
MIMATEYKLPYTASEIHERLDAITSKIDAPSTATVGQTIRVSEVDESGKPISWECVDMASGGSEELELLYDITTEEELKNITHTFIGERIKKLIYAIYVTEAESAASSTTVRLTTDEKGLAHFRNVSLRLPSIPQTVETTLVATFEILREAGGNSIAITSSRLNYYPQSWAAEQLQSTVHTVNYVMPSPTDSYKNKMGDYITGIQINTAGMFAIGTRIKIWGVKE